MNTTADIDAYIANAPEPARATLEQLRALIRAVAPDAAESISYGMPAFKHRGKPLAYIAAAKNHVALYGLSTDEAEAAGYDTSQKGTIRFPPGKPVPEALVTRLLTARKAQIDSAATARSAANATPASRES